MRSRFACSNKNSAKKIVSLWLCEHKQYKRYEKAATLKTPWLYVNHESYKHDTPQMESFMNKQQMNR